MPLCQQEGNFSWSLALPNGNPDFFWLLYLAWSWFVYCISSHFCSRLTTCNTLCTCVQLVVAIDITVNVRGLFILRTSVLLILTGGESFECWSAETATSLERGSGVSEGDNDFSCPTGEWFQRSLTFELERFVANVIRSKMSFIGSGQIELPLYIYSVAAISYQRQTLFVHVVVRFPYYFYHFVTLIALWCLSRLCICSTMYMYSTCRYLHF